MREYIQTFFDELEVYEDIQRGHCCKLYIRQAILAFLDHETKDTAFDVYAAFFDSYRVVLEGCSNPFIDLLDVLKNYEENAAVLISKQRDHYIHSVNVFILGLCVYAGNKRYRNAFAKAVMDKAAYPYSYDTRHEEFFYRWGLASLFHDVGYPVEIVGRQVNEFIDFTTRVVKGEQKVNVELSFERFEELNRIPEIVPKRDFTRCYDQAYPDSVYIDMLKPVDLLAHKLHAALGVDLQAAKFALDDFVNVMGRFGFIDHGYFSAIIVLKWYGYLIQCADYRPEYFFWPVLDSASAILLHNCYKNMMMKKPFGLGQLSPETHPIAYLLILCDELQEWNRTAYGKLDRQRTLAARAKLAVTDQSLAVTFTSYNAPLPRDFSVLKKKLLYRMLDLSKVFDTVSIHCRVKKQSALPPPSARIIARPKLSDLEKLAKAIHALYNEEQMKRHPDQPLKYPDFDALTETLKYSNLRQAMDIPKKLRSMGYTMLPEGSPGTPVTAIPEAYVETLAELEHEAWMAERIATGWVPGTDADPEKKTTPYLIPYRLLPDEVKDLDRDPVKNIPRLLREIGMAVYPLDEADG